jgi:hypothetical protein
LGLHPSGTPRGIIERLAHIAGRAGNASAIVCVALCVASRTWRLVLPST